MNISRIGLGIDQQTGDIVLDEDGNLIFVRDAEAVGQHARQRLGMFKGEWFLDTEAGVPWLEDILGRRADLALTEAVIKKELMETDGVTGITSFSTTFSQRERGISASRISVTTQYDEEVAI